MHFKCQLCDKEIYHNRFRSHVLSHSISPQEYYDKFILNWVRLMEEKWHFNIFLTSKGTN